MSLSWGNNFPFFIIMQTEKYSTQHGGPYDRGSADYYYSRGMDPHYYPNGTGNAPRIEAEDMTEAEKTAYFAGYEEETDQKSWY
jgi:hypothetical protein